LIHQTKQDRTTAQKMDSKFYNKDGSNTFYSFACGYIQRIETAKMWKELYFEHNTFHVRSGELGNKWQVWENFDRNELTKARKFYRSIKLNAL